MAPLPDITLKQLADFMGKPVESLASYARDCIANSTLFLRIRTGIVTDPAQDTPPNQDLADLLQNARLDLANRLYLDRMFYERQYNPFSSETLGDYSYNMSTAVKKLLLDMNKPTGVMWVDLLLQYLENNEPNENVSSGGVIVFEKDDIRYSEEYGQWYVPNKFSEFGEPGDMSSEDQVYFYRMDI